MKIDLLAFMQTVTQGRRVKDANRLYRSLKHGSGQSRTLGFVPTPLRLCLHSLLVVLLATLAAVSVSAQEVEDTIHIKTRVVFLDALVKDKKTNLPISNLTPENFEVLDNGKPRPVSYFTREGQARKPLALILILDLREDGAGRFLKRPEIVKAMEEQLSKLPAGDEVAIMAMNIGEDEKRIWITQFTNERKEIAAALDQVRTMCELQSAPSDKHGTQDDKPAEDVQQAAANEKVATERLPSDAKEDPKQIVSTEVIKGRNGGTVTRTIRRDGSVDVTRKNKSGNVTIEFDDIYDMAAAVQDASRKAQHVRPNSQVSVVWISDGIAPIFYEDRDATELAIVRDNIIFNSLTVELRTLFKLLMPIGKPIAGWMGVSLYGSAKYLAQRSGGEAVKVGSTRDYGAGLARIIGNLSARYSLGFTLAEDEADDGRMHALEVRVKARDEKGKNRKLLVSSRQGYYMSSVAPKSAANAQ
ncbi:MAG TPA: VWA domain-containing protein [Pyrinomonadaceae bacterium]|nr:VWA domain-containing protein [Pyrinomonadaceae bacterium]